MIAVDFSKKLASVVVGAGLFGVLSHAGKKMNGRVYKTKYLFYILFSELNNDIKRFLIH